MTCLVKFMFFTVQLQLDKAKENCLFDSNGSRRFSSGRTFPSPAFDVLVKAEVTTSSSSGLRHRKMDGGMRSYIKSIPYCLSPRGKLYLVRASSETKITKKRIELLDSYFEKLQNDDEKPSISTGDEINRKAELSAKEELESLSVYLDKLQKDASSKGLVRSMVKSEGMSVESKLRKTDTKINNRLLQQFVDDEDSEDPLNFYAA